MRANFNPPKDLVRFFEEQSGRPFTSPDTNLDAFNRVIQTHPDFNVPMVTVPLEEESIASEFLLRNYQSVLQYEFIPLFNHGIQLCIAMTKAWNSVLIKDIMRAFNVELKIVSITEANFEELKSICFLLQEKNQEFLKLESKRTVSVKAVGTWSFDRSNPRKIVEQILSHSYKSDASDVHLDFLHDRLRVRSRIHGKLENQAPIAKEYAQDVIRAFKSFASIPSDTKKAFSSSGRLYIEGRAVDFRVEYQPSSGGGAVVARILDNAKWHDPEWRKLPFEGNDLKTVQRILKGENGLILVTGPTGSGKTTTLLRCLLNIGPEVRNIRTIEDPVEYQLPNVTHVGVDKNGDTHEEGFGFKEGIRSHMRSDPDVILVGEIRDLETAEAALEGALTGHLLLSTLHTMDAISSVERLLEIGVDPWRLKSTLRLIVSQRLVPCLCPRCCYALPLTDAIRQDFLSVGLEPPEKHYVADGCPDCGDRGNFGRQAIFEILDLSRDLGELANPDTLKELHEAWTEQGNGTLFKSALELVASGVLDLRTARSFKGRF